MVQKFGRMMLMESSGKIMDDDLKIMYMSGRNDINGMMRQEHGK